MKCRVSLTISVAKRVALKNSGKYACTGFMASNSVA